MAFYDLTWYCNAGDQATTGHYAVTKWAASVSIAAGALRRQLAAPSVNNERVFVCIVAGTTGGSEPTWVLTRGAKTTDNTVTWQECTGASAVNGDLTNTANWTTAKAAGAPTLGAIIKRNNGASYQICTTAGAMGASEPSFSDTAGTTTTDSSAVWTSLGVVGNFTGGQAPHARLNNLFGSNWFTAGNTIYVADNHAESQTAPNMSMSIPGSATIISRILCHNHSGSYPPAAGDLTTGATVSALSFASITLSFTNSGAFYVYGIAFKAGSGTPGSTVFLAINNSAGGWSYFDRCSFQIIATGSSNTIQFGGVSAPSSTILNNTTVYFGNVADSISILFSQFVWQNTGQVLATGSSVPTSFIAATNPSGGQQNNMILEALDLSQLTGNLFSSTQQTWLNLLIKDCKLNAAATIPALTNNSGMTVQLVRCDSGATAYKSARYSYEGVETTETTITRVGGATDPAGQLQSRKIVTTANINWLRPFKAEPYAIWNAVTGTNVTVTVCGTVNAGALPLNDDVWLECEYISDTASPLGKIITTTKSNALAAGTAVASDSSTWNSTAGNTTLNPADKDTHITLSGGNLTAAGTAGWTGFVRAVDAKSAGKLYWETTFNATQVQSGVGLAIGSLSVATQTFTNAGTGKCGLVQTGVVWVDGASTITVGGGGTGINFGTITSGTVICVAVDLTAQLIWFRLGAAGNWNNNATFNPATGVGGASIPNVGTAFPTDCFGGADTLISNFGSSAFTGSVPSGFTAGWPQTFLLTPFKLTTTLSSPQPGLAGYIHARVRAAKASTTYYIDPQIVLS